MMEAYDLPNLRTKLLKNVSWNLFASIARLAISCFVSIFTARYLGPSNFGMLSYVTSFSSFFTAICNLGINSILAKELLDDPDHQGVVLGSTFFMRFISTVCCMIANCGLIAILNPDDRLYLILAAIQSLYLLFTISDSLNYWFQARLENKISAISSTVGYFVMAVYRIYLLATHKSIIWFAVATSLDMVVVGLLLLICYIRKGGPKFSISISRCKSIIGKSKHFILAGLMVSLYNQMDKVMLNSMIDSSSVAFYSTANSINSMWTFVIAAIIDSVSPVIYSAYNESRAVFKKRLKMLYQCIIWLCLMAGVVICLSSKTIINLLYGASYMDAVPVLCVLVWSVMFSYLGVAKNIWVVSENKNKYLVAFTGMGIIGNLILNSILIPQYGAVGAAVATVVTQFISSVAAQLCFKETREGCIWMFEAFMFKDTLSLKEIKEFISGTLHNKDNKEKEGK